MLGKQCAQRSLLEADHLYCPRYVADLLASDLSDTPG